MSITEALEKVSKSYVPGVAKFYNFQTPDPWFTAHEDFERAVLTEDEEIKSAAAKLFVDRCVSLIELYRKSGMVQRGSSNADAMFSMNDQTVANWKSRRHKVCARCDSKENLMLERVNGSETDVFVICAGCKSKNKRSAA